MDNRLERSRKIVFDKEYENTANEKNLKYLKRYEMDMSLRGLSEKSIYNYKRDLLSWFAYLNINQFDKCVDEVEEDDIEEFIFYCKEQGNNAKRLKRRLSSISAFYIFLRRKKFVKENPTEFIARPKDGLPVVQKNFLTVEQVAQIREFLEKENNTQLTAYFEVSLCTMARVNAISTIKWGQLDYDGFVVHNVLEKEGYIVDLFLDERTVEVLKKLEKEREEQGIDNEYVFITKYGGEFKKAESTNLSTWATKIGKAIDVPTLSPHDFRRSSATLRHNAGLPIEEISFYLNHKGIDVTRIYIKEDLAKKGKQFRSFSI